MSDERCPQTRVTTTYPNVYINYKGQYTPVANITVQCRRSKKVCDGDHIYGVPSRGVL